MTPNSSPATAPLHDLLALLLLILMAVLSGGAALHESITIDEVPHLGAGVSYLQKLDFRMNEEHPPLAKILAAAPIVARGVHADYSNVSWTFSQGFFQATLGEWAWGQGVALRWNDPRITLLWARFPMLLLTLLLGGVLYVFGARLGGAWAGLLCLAAYVSTPAFLAFGPLIITDIAVTLFCILTMWMFAELWHSPSRATLLKFSFALAGALLSKFSSGLLLISFLAFALSLRWLPLSDQPKERDKLRHWRRVRTRYLWKGIGLAALIVYVVYLALSWNQPTDSLDRLGAALPALFLRRLLMPSWLYLRGLAIFSLQSQRSTFILGHSYAHGVWFYFPVLFVLKSTIAFLALLVLALIVAFIARRILPANRLVPPEVAFHWRAVRTFFVVFTVACLLSPLDLSIRHFTVPIALLILALAPLPRAIEQLKHSPWRLDQAARALAVVLTFASLTTVVRGYPNYLPFLSSLTFGHPGYEMVNDSNLDWNQSLPAAEIFIQQHNWHDVLVDEYGFSDPTVYIPGAQLWNCQQPSVSDSGRSAIVSANMIEESHNCLWLMNYPHQAIAGGSMYAFQLPPAIPPAGQPGGPPLPADYHSFGGAQGDVDFRQIFFNVMKDPNQLQPTLDQLAAHFAPAEKKK